MNGKKLVVTVLLLLLLIVTPIRALAMESVTEEIPFTIKNVPGTVVIEAVDGAPLPLQSVYEGVSSGSITMTFDAPGDYRYKIYQKPGTEPGVTYDTTVYSLCASVFVNDNGEWYIVAEASTVGSSQKAEALVFENTPATTSAPTNPGTPPKTGDDSNLGLLLLLMVVSFLGSAVFFIMWHKANRSSKE